MHRREALRNVAFLLGGAISASTMGVLFESFTIPEHEKNHISFTPEEEKAFAEFADIIMPTTKSSAGAKAAGLGKFIPMMMKDCYPATMQTSFAKGFKEFEAKSVKDFGKSFVLLPLTDRQKLMADVRTIAIDPKVKEGADKDLAYYFVTARDLTLLGYFSSEIGCTQAREYVLIPGRYDGDVKLKPGQKSWAT